MVDDCLHEILLANDFKEPKYVGRPVINALRKLLGDSRYRPEFVSLGASDPHVPMTWGRTKNRPKGLKYKKKCKAI